MHDPKDLKAPPKVRRVVMVVFWVWAAFYVSRLFHLCILDPLIFADAEQLADLATDETGETLAFYRYVMTWFEFAVLHIALLVAVAGMYTLILLREIWGFLRKGRAGLILSGMGHLALILLPLSAAHILVGVLSGVDFAGTRIGGLPLPAMMFVAASVAMASLLATIFVLVAPRRSQQAFDSHRRGNGTG